MNEPKYYSLMRRLLLLLMLSLPMVLRAQTGLGINSLFQGKIVPQERMVETRVRGRSISAYGLSFYRSVRAEVSRQELMRIEGELMRIEGLYKIDAKEAMEQETKKKSDSWCNSLIALPAKGGKGRFLSFQYKRKGGQYSLTVVYLEGSATTIADLRSRIKM